MYDDAGTLVSGSFVDYLLPTAADTISFDIEPHHVAVDHQHARHQGRRRGRHHRVDAGGRQRDRRRGPAPRRQRHRDAVHARAGVEGDQPHRRRRRRSHGGVGDAALRRGRTATRTPARPGKERTCDPRTVRLRRADHARGGADALSQARRRREDHRRRAEPAAGAPDAAQRTRDGHRPRQDRGAARHPRRRRRDRDRRDDPALGGRLRPAGRRARAADPQGGRAPRRRPDPAPRDLRRRARARRPGR